MKTFRLGICISVLCSATACGTSETPETAAIMTENVDMTWVEKYVTYRQDHSGQLHPTDYHFLAEIIYAERSMIDDVETHLYVQGNEKPIASFGPTDPYAFTNGLYYTRKSESFNDLEAIEAAHPASSSYAWGIQGPSGKYRLDRVRIGGPELRTQIPDTSPIYLSQDGAPVSKFENIDSNKPLNIRWNAFTIGKALEGTQWHDLIFVLVSDCHGTVVFTSGAPEDETGYADFTATSTEVPVGMLEPGMDYVVFISQVNYVDHNISHGIEQFAANSFAVELNVKTSGTLDIIRTCPEPANKAAYLWSGKTPAEAGLVPWPTFLDPSNNPP